MKIKVLFPSLLAMMFLISCAKKPPEIDVSTKSVSEIVVLLANEFQRKGYSIFSFSDSSLSIVKYYNFFDYNPGIAKLYKERMTKDQIELSKNAPMTFRIDINKISTNFKTLEFSKILFVKDRYKSSVESQRIIGELNLGRFNNNPIFVTTPVLSYQIRPDGDIISTCDLFFSNSISFQTVEDVLDVFLLLDTSRSLTTDISRILITELNEEELLRKTNNYYK